MRVHVRLRVHVRVRVPVRVGVWGCGGVGVWGVGVWGCGGVEVWGCVWVCTPLVGGNLTPLTGTCFSCFWGYVITKNRVEYFFATTPALGATPCATNPETKSRSDSWVASPKA